MQGSGVTHRRDAGAATGAAAADDLR